MQSFSRVIIQHSLFKNMYRMVLKFVALVNYIFRTTHWCTMNQNNKI